MSQTFRDNERGRNIKYRNNSITRSYLTRGASSQQPSSTYQLNRQNGKGAFNIILCRSNLSQQCGPSVPSVPWVRLYRTQAKQPITNCVHRQQSSPIKCNQPFRGTQYRKSYNITYKRSGLSVLGCCSCTGG